MSDGLEIVYSDVEFARHRSQRKKNVVCISAWITIIAIVPWSIFAMLKGMMFLVGLNVLQIAMGALALVLCQRGRVNPAAHILTISLIAYITIGIGDTEGFGNERVNYGHNWLLVIAMGMLMALYDARRSVTLAYLGICTLIYAAIGLKWFELAPREPIPQDLLAIYPEVTMLPIFIAVILITRVFITDIRRAEQLLALANNKLESLIENMLPQPIAERLRREGRSFADGIEECSVLFADIVDFTPLSARMPPQQLVDLLNRLFGRFDDLAESFGVEKIKTIGDAYMAAAGLPNRRSDHAEVLARFALAMRDSIGEFPGLSLRIGINSGPVVAGVIGKKRYIYDMWGDAVNMAERMESHGMPDSIQVTRSTHDLIADRFELIALGKLDVKGRGGVEAFHLVRERTYSPA